MARQGREPLDGLEMEGGFGLSGREAEVAEWLCAGKSNPEIAAILGISPRTAEKHVEAIFKKLGVSSRSPRCK